MEACTRGAFSNTIVDDSTNSNPIILLNYDFGLATCFIILLVFGFVFRVMGFICLKNLIKKVG